MRDMSRLTIVCAFILSLHCVPAISSNFIVVEGTPCNLYRSNGDGTFLKVDVGWGGLPIAVSDFNRDPYSDVIVYRGGDLFLYVNQGNEQFTEHPLGATPTTYNRTCGESGDFNNDGWCDFILAQSIYDTGTAALFLYLNNGSNTFTEHQLDLSWYSNCVYSCISDARIGDFNEDGNLDFALIHYCCSGDVNDVYLYTGDGEGAFSWQLAFSNFNPEGTPTVFSGDYNEDNHTDMIAGLDDDTDAGQTWLYTGDGLTSFTLAGEAFDTNPESESGQSNGTGRAISHKFNGDDHLDVLATKCYIGSTRLDILFFPGVGDGSFVEPGVLIDTVQRVDTADHSMIRGPGFPGVNESISASFMCTPTWGTLPFAPRLGATLKNLTENYRTLAGRVDVTLAAGNLYANYRAGYTNLLPVEQREFWWNQNLPDVGNLVGENTFLLTAVDVTPAPYNQPPFWPSGSSDTDSCTVEGSRGKTMNAELTCEPSAGTVPFTSEICVALENDTTYTRQLAYRVERTNASGGFNPNYKHGYQNVAPKSVYTLCWDEIIADDGSMTGDNLYTLVGEDITPAPWNQPPYPAAGDTATSDTTISGESP